MQVSTVTARISNILLIKSLLVARLANRHSCVTAGAQIAPKCCSWLHPTELIIYQRGAPVLTLFNPPPGLFSLPKSERKKNLVVNIDLTNTSPPPRKEKKSQSPKFHLSIIRTWTHICLHSLHSPLILRQGSQVVQRPRSPVIHHPRRRSWHKQETLGCVDSGRRALYTAVKLWGFTPPHIV